MNRTNRALNRIVLFIVGILFQYVYNPRYGLLNTTLEAMGLDSLTRTWLGDPSTILWAIAFVAIWAAIGLVVYFTYSRSHSHLGRGIIDVHEDDADIPPQPVPPLPGAPTPGGKDA